MSPTMTPGLNDEQLLHSLRAGADRLMLISAAFLLLASLGIGALTNTWNIGLMVGLPALLVPMGIYRLSPGSLASRIAFACAFMIFAALLIQQTHGVVEAHFSIFVLLAFLLYYRDWRPIVAASAVIAVHHLGFNFMQAAGMGVYVLVEGANLPLILVHAAFVVAEAGMLIYMAHQLRIQASESMQVAMLAERIGQGDLTQAPDAQTLNNRPLLAKVAEMQKQLVDTLGGVSANSSAVSHTAQTLATSSKDVDKSMDQLSESTSDMAATIEQLTVSISHISDSATEAHQLAEQSGQSSRSGSTVVKSTIDEIGNIASSIGTLSDNMENLGTQFDNVSKVVVLINDIANQTNLLALNAAIEAARAGEQGRGFAVVADEVRKLAERTRQATEDIISTMQGMQTSKDSALSSIKTTVQMASSGVSMASEAGAAIDSISTDVQRVQEVVMAISDALREQSAAATDIARNIEQISQMAESTSHTANNATKETDELSRIADALTSSIVQFKLH